MAQTLTLLNDIAFPGTVAQASDFADVVARQMGWDATSALTRQQYIRQQVIAQLKALYRAGKASAAAATAGDAADTTAGSIT